MKLIFWLCFAVVLLIVCLACKDKVTEPCPDLPRDNWPELACDSMVG